MGGRLGLGGLVAVGDFGKLERLIVSSVDGSGDNLLFRLFGLDLFGKRAVLGSL